MTRHRCVPERGLSLLYNPYVFKKSTFVWYPTGVLIAGNAPEPPSDHVSTEIPGGSFEISRRVLLRTTLYYSVLQCTTVYYCVPLRTTLY